MYILVIFILLILLLVLFVLYRYICNDSCPDVSIDNKYSIVKYINTYAGEQFRIEEMITGTDPKFLLLAYITAVVTFELEENLGVINQIVISGNDLRWTERIPHVEYQTSIDREPIISILSPNDSPTCANYILWDYSNCKIQEKSLSNRGDTLLRLYYGNQYISAIFIQNPIIRRMVSDIVTNTCNSPDINFDDITNSSI
ncbi:Hypothetical protein ORPV_1044 [Orpheovirus IHUMI-LCC2]|uniref:Uncharacterized protein n=1 Tax=Orpheovirus IHUMI-LCC2 TaxID=2023057 RepID=A0A2I2L5W6_9VIRU|nr:Hypothetical protein ORPV_1044 [Orpheovirus IHUMI-LCC2]SNW62948.1 Hypothetical protein ORPV_1044 [Orpheovirus IHUMI-LCC2]